MVSWGLLTLILGVAIAVVGAALVLVVVIIRRSNGRQFGNEAASADPLAGLEHREELMADREARLSRGEDELRQREAELAHSEAVLEAAVANQKQEQEVALAQIAGLSPEAARAELLAQAESQARVSAAKLAKQIETEAQDQAERNAREIIVTAMQRLASEQTQDAVSVTVPLPGEEMKGRLIGRDGRNIRSFEHVTGTTLVIDDTPGVVELSCFDPLRREIARQTLIDLIADGRIHPGRIEQTHARFAVSVEEGCTQRGTDAALELGITDLDPAILEVLGALQYRTSYGQNVLAHLVESGRLAGLLAAELGLEAGSVRRAGFLHDLGKALPEDAGSHALAGAEFARQHGEHPDVVHAIEAHHNEVAPATVEAVLVQIADSISGARPGARRESVQAYTDRLEGLEQIAQAEPGVERVFAVQAGHEVRVMVRPEQVDDAQAEALASRIASRIQAELSYPGSIKVTVVRESRATAVAR